MLSWEYPPHIIGGLGQHVYDLSRFLVKANIMVDLIIPHANNMPDHQYEQGVAIYRVGEPYLTHKHLPSWTFAFNSEIIKAAIKINAAMQKFERFDVIHAHDWLVAYAGRVLAKIFNIPLVTTIHATERGRYLDLHNHLQREIDDIERNLAQAAKRIICCSQYMRIEVCKLFAINDDKITIIPNGVDANQFTQLPQTPLIDFDPLAINIFFIGRLVHEKGISNLIRAMPHVLAALPHARLYIGGTGEELPTFKELACSLNVATQVVFTGFLSSEQRNLLYRHADVAVFPSHYEPFGIVALEAMATRTPLIVGDVGGLSEIVTHGINGLKITPGNEEQLAKAIIILIENHELATSMTENAFATIMNQYNWQTIAATTIKVYDSV